MGLITADCIWRLPPRFMIATIAASALGFALGASPADAQVRQPAPRAPEAQNPQEAYAGPAMIGPTMTLVAGKSTLLRLDAPIDRVSVGNPSVADVTIISPRELYILGKTHGATNVILWQ